MKGWKSVLLILAALGVLSPAIAVAEGTPGAKCISCHDTVTPGIVKQWEDSKHSKVGVKCYLCHKARKGDPSGYDHNGFYVTAVPSPRYCGSCHSKEVEEYSNSKHAWAAFFGPLKPYYIKARKAGLDDA